MRRSDGRIGGERRIGAERRGPEGAARPGDGVACGSPGQGSEGRSGGCVSGEGAARIAGAGFGRQGKTEASRGSPGVTARIAAWKAAGDQNNANGQRPGHGTKQGDAMRRGTEERKEEGGTEALRRRAHYFRLTSDQDQITRPTMHFCQSPSKSSMRLSTRGGLSAALSE